MRLILPVPSDRRPRRFLMLFIGLIGYGASSGLIVQANLGNDPWDVLHQGLARSIGGQVGTWTIIMSVVVLLFWIPLRQRPGVGTLCNALVIGLSVNATLALVSTPHGWGLRIGLLVAGVLINAAATGLYIGAGLGPGARDGLTTGLAARGHQVRVVRTLIEVSVLAIGWLLGGSVGVGTVLYAATIGPLTHFTLPWLALRQPAARPSAASVVAS